MMSVFNVEMSYQLHVQEKTIGSGFQLILTLFLLTLSLMQVEDARHAPAKMFYSRKLLY
jgi:hypothetical protein